MIKRGSIQLVLAASLLAASVHPSTPLSTIKAVGASQSLSQCGGPVQLLWQDGVGQVDVAVIDDSGKVVRSFDRQPANTNSLTWYPVNATAGQKLYLVVKDEAGTTSTSNAMTVASGASSCNIVADPALPSFTLFSGAPVSTTPLSSSGAGGATGSTTYSRGIASTTTDITSPTSTSTSTATTVTSTPTSSSSSSMSTTSATTSTTASTSGQNAAAGLADAFTLSSTLVFLASLLSSLL